MSKAGKPPPQFSVSATSPIHVTLPMMKSLTPEQLQSRKGKAVRFTRNVLDDPDRAEETEDDWGDG
ncbi:MAG TPA: hypothetical protein VE959_04530 [Bryobacteraceae bacterium]|nr:hypothetical protein [Bryobacteraceae bacterium]